MTQQQYDRNLKVIELARSGKFEQCFGWLTQNDGQCHCYTGLVLEVYEQENQVPSPFEDKYLLPPKLYKDFMGWPSDSGPDVKEDRSLLGLNDACHWSFSTIANLHEQWLNKQSIE